MVNLWPGVEPRYLCDKHLNAAINEGLNLLIRHHMAKGHKIDGWIRNGCVDLSTLESRIKNLIKESNNRGKSWKYHYTIGDADAVYEYFDFYMSNGMPTSNHEAILNNHNKLLVRCTKCQKKFIDAKE